MKCFYLVYCVLSDLKTETLVLRISIPLLYSTVLYHVCYIISLSILPLSGFGEVRSLK